MIFVGSHDPLLDWALRESRSGIPTFFDGSLHGLKRLGPGAPAAVGLHLYEPASDDWTTKHVAEALGDAEVMLLAWTWTDRGMVVAPDHATKTGRQRHLPVQDVGPAKPG